MSDYPDVTPGSILAAKVRQEHQQWKRESSFAASNGSDALGEKKWNVICTLLDAAKPSYESGDDEQHRAYCQAIGILIRKWQP